MTGMSRFLPPHVRRETDGAITRISNASQRRVPEQTPIRLTRIATGAPFLSILAYAHLVGATERPSARARLSAEHLAVCQALPFVFHHGDGFIRRARHVRARVYTWGCLYFASMLPVRLWSRAARPRIRYCCIQSGVLAPFLSPIHPRRNIRSPPEGGKVVAAVFRTNIRTAGLARTGWPVINVHAAMSGKCIWVNNGE